MRIKISKLTVGLSLAIIISASFNRQLMDFVQRDIGKTGFVILVESILLISGLGGLVFIFKKVSGFIKRLTVVILLTIGSFLLFYYIKIPEEKMHILEYAFLGWLAAKDLVKREKAGKRIILALLFCAAVGILDELFQAILPYRFFQTKDIAYNWIGGAGGITLYLLV